SSALRRMGKTKPEVAQRAREAEHLLRDCLAIRLNALEPASSRLADTKSRLGGAVSAVAVTEPSLQTEARQEKFTDAEALLVEAMTVFEGTRSGNARYERDTM